MWFLSVSVKVQEDVEAAGRQGGQGERARTLLPQTAGARAAEARAGARAPHLATCVPQQPWVGQRLGARPAGRPGPTQPLRRQQHGLLLPQIGAGAPGPLSRESPRWLPSAAPAHRRGAGPRAGAVLGGQRGRGAEFSAGLPQGPSLQGFAGPQRPVQTGVGTSLDTVQPRTPRAWWGQAGGRPDACRYSLGRGAVCSQRPRTCLPAQAPASPGPAQGLHTTALRPEGGLSPGTWLPTPEKALGGGERLRADGMGW